MQRYPDVPPYFTEIAEQQASIIQNILAQGETLKDLARFLRESPVNRVDRWELLNLFTNKFVLLPSMNGYLRLYVLINQAFTFNVDVPGLPIFSWNPPQGLTQIAFPEGTKFQVVTPAPANPGAAVPCRLLYTDSFPFDTTTLAFLLNSIVIASQAPLVASPGTNIGSVGFVSNLPFGAIPVDASSGNVANAVATATLPAVAGKTTWITGFEITGSGATAALVVVPTVANIASTLSYVYAAVAGATLINSPLIIEFPEPIPATGQNITIPVSCPALGAGNTNNAVDAHGYQL